MRATDRTGHLQTARRTKTFPDGASGYDELQIDVGKE